MSTTLFATGFVADPPGEGTLFPSAGGNSASPKVQAIYWRCIVTLFASARINNPEQRMALFCNVRPPRIGRVDIGQVLGSYGVEIRLVPLKARLAKGRTEKWGNVLYFLDILDSLGGEPDDLRVALVDSDVLVTAPLAPLFALLDGTDYAGYIVDSDPDENINGLSRREMSDIAGGLAEAQPGLIDHYGGELFMTKVETWRRDRHVFLQLLDNAMTNSGAGARILTEEHLFSIGFSIIGRPVASAGGMIKRLWTGPRFFTVKPGDEMLALWHLPAEKRHGLRDLYLWLAAKFFPVTMDPGLLRLKARTLCGVPRRSIAKFARDGVRQILAQLDL